MNEGYTQISTQLVAWWGAIVATLVLLWDVFKWKTSGARLRVQVSTNMQTFSGVVEDDNTYVLAVVVNVGSHPTTITHLTMHYYKNMWARLRGKPIKSMLVAKPSTNQPIPYILKPGEQWMGMAIQNEELERLATSGLLYAAVIHTSGEHPIYRRIKLSAHNS